MNYTRVKIVANVPPEATDAVRHALGKAGAGVFGEYSFCSFAIPGKGYSLPSEKANPYIGEPGKLEVIDEERIEVTCDLVHAKSAVKAMKAAIPYEEPAFDIYPLLTEDEL